jgi:hypothetical protein
MQQEAKREQARAAAQSLGKLISDLQTRVAQAESQAEDFRSRMGLLVGSNNATIATQQLGDLNKELSTSRVAQADAQAKAKLLREMLRQKRVGEIPDVANNELIRRIAEQRVALGAQLALESRTLLPAHPRIKELRAQLAKLDADWRREAERTARTLENDARIAGARVENLQRALEEQKKVAGAAGADEVRLRELERVARLLKEQLETETAKYQEALARETVKATPADARVVQRALAPQIPSFPKRLPITVFSTLAAFVLSSGAIVAAELLSDRPRLRGNLGPVNPPPSPGGATPQPGGEPSGPTGKETLDSAREAPTATSARAIEPQPEMGGGALTPSVKVLAFICGDADRDAAPAVELARALSRRGRAILAAAHMADVSYDRLVEAVGRVERPKGLSDLIAGRANFADVIHRDAGSRLHVLPSGAGEGAVQYQAPLVVDALAQTYDFVVFATSSLERARELASLFDMTLIKGDGEAAEHARSELVAAGASNVTMLDDAGDAQKDLFAA